MWNDRDPSSGNHNGGQDRHGGYANQHPANGAPHNGQGFANQLTSPPAQHTSNFAQSPFYHSPSSSVDSGYPSNSAYPPHTSSQSGFQHSQAPRAEDPRAAFQRAPAPASHHSPSQDTNYAHQAFSQPGFEPNHAHSPIHQPGPSAQAHSRPFNHGNDFSDDRRSHQRDDRYGGRGGRVRGGGGDKRFDRDRRGGRGGRTDDGPVRRGGRSDNKSYQHDNNHHNHSGGPGGPPHAENHSRQEKNNGPHPGPHHDGAAPHSAFNGTQHSHSHHLPDSGVPQYTGTYGRASKDYVSLFRPYPVHTPSMDVCEIMHRYGDIRVPLNLCRTMKNWTSSIPLSPESLEHPPIHLNTPIPLIVNSTPLPAPQETQSPSYDANHPRIEIRILLVSGAPIDISAPKVGQQHHSNDKISFIMFERFGEAEERHLSIPGGLFDPLLDSISGEPSNLITDEELVRATKRIGRQQLGLDLTPCSQFYRFLEFEYSTTSSYINHRVIYVLPSIWDLLHERTEFEAAWRAWKSEEIKNGWRNDVLRLHKHLTEVDRSTRAYEDLQGRIRDREAQLQLPVTLSPELARPPDAPAVLMTEYTGAPNNGKIVMCTLTHIIQLRDPAFAEICMVAAGFDEYLQCFFGSGIYAHLALMLADLTEDKAPLHFGSVLLAARKRPHALQTPPFANSSPSQQHQDQVKTESEPSAKRPVKVEVKSENGELHSLRPDAPSMTSLDAQHQQLAFNNTHPHGNAHPGAHHAHQAVEPVQSVPYTPGRAPPLMPQCRDYRLMQAFRYFDLNRLGFIRGEDCERLLLTLGLGLSRATALDLTAAGHVQLPHHPTIAADYKPADPLRYKPVCDWLKSHGLTMPSSGR